MAKLNVLDFLLGLQFLLYRVNLMFPECADIMDQMFTLRYGLFVILHDWYIPGSVLSIIIVLVLLWFYCHGRWYCRDNGAQHHLNQCSKNVQLFAYKVYFTIQKYNVLSQMCNVYVEMCNDNNCITNKQWFIITVNSCVCKFLLKVLGHFELDDIVLKLAAFYIKTLKKHPLKIWADLPICWMVSQLGFKSFSSAYTFLCHVVFEHPCISSPSSFHQSAVFMMTSAALLRTCSIHFLWMIDISCWHSANHSWLYMVLG